MSNQHSPYDIIHGGSSSCFSQLPLQDNLLHSTISSSLRGHASHILLFFTFQYMLTHIQCRPYGLQHTPYFCLGIRIPFVTLQCSYNDLPGS